MSQNDMALRLDHLLAGRTESPKKGKPLFLFPGVGGDEPRLLHFRAGCGPDLSIRCLDYGSWTQWVEPGAFFDTIVRQMMARIQEQAPSGPLTLAGYSLGGHVALAVAAALSAAGREIERVLIMDSGVISPSHDDDGIRMQPPRFAPPLSWRDEWREWQVARRRGEGAFALSLIVVRRLISPRRAPLLRWIARHRRAVLPGKIDFYLSFHLQRCVLLDLATAWRKSLTQGPRIAAPLMIFKVHERAVREELVWMRHSPAVTMISVGGDHFTMFDPPHLADLCAKFTAACSPTPMREVALP